MEFLQSQSYIYTICVKKTGLVKNHESMKEAEKYFIYIFEI